MTKTLLIVISMICTNLLINYHLNLQINNRKERRRLESINVQIGCLKGVGQISGLLTYEQLVKVNTDIICKKGNNEIPH